MTTSPAPSAVTQAAARLIEANASGRPCAPVRDLIGTTDAAAAYAVAGVVLAERLRGGSRVVGRKIGLTSPAVQAQLGVDRPDFGVLLDDMAFSDGADIPADRLLQPKAEAEVAFVLGQDLADGPLDDAQLRSAVDHAVAALEIVDSRIADWDITFGDTVADNGSSAFFVLGTQRRTLDEIEPVDVTMEMAVDGVVVSTGSGAACLGDPLAALAWLARTALELGDPLRAGHVVLSGALGPMHPIHPGARIAAEVSGLGTVRATLSRKEQS